MEARLVLRNTQLTASLFNQVDITLGGKLISSATNTYAHHSILEVLLNYDKEAAESQLGCGLFCKDTIGQMDEIDINADPLLTTGLEQGVNGQKRPTLLNYRVGFTQTYSVKKNLF